MLKEVKIILADGCEKIMQPAIGSAGDFDAGIRFACLQLLSTAKTIDVDGLAGEVFNWFVENDVKVQMLRSPEAKILQAGEHVEPAKRLAAAILDYISGGKG